MKTQKKPLKRRTMGKDGEGPAVGVIKIRPVKRLLAWRNDAGCQSHIVSNHYQGKFGHGYKQ